MVTARDEICFFPGGGEKEQEYLVYPLEDDARRFVQAATEGAFGVGPATFRRANYLAALSGGSRPNI